MSQGRMTVGGGEPLQLQHLSQDVLEEVFSRCTHSCLMRLRRTCKMFADLILTSEKVWLVVLERRYGLKLKVLPGEERNLFMLASRLGGLPSRGHCNIRYQGTLVTGGVDADAAQYWVDNMFMEGRAPFCSKVGTNANCIGLLLDESVPSEKRFIEVRQYVMQRCCYAAALFLAQNGNVQAAPSAVIAEMERWPDMELEAFFRDLVNHLVHNDPRGRLLLYDMAGDRERIAAETARLTEAHRFLQERHGQRRAALLALDAARDVLFDTSVGVRLRFGETRRCMGLIHRILLSRRGALTCPVRTGVVFVGRCRWEEMCASSDEAIGGALADAARSVVSTRFDDMACSASVVHASERGAMPRIRTTDEHYAGLVHEFDLQDDAWCAEAAVRRHGGVGPTSSAPATPHVEFRPLVWFRFHAQDEASAFAQRAQERYGSWRDVCIRHRGRISQRSPNLRPAPVDTMPVLETPIQERAATGVPASGHAAAHDDALPRFHAQSTSSENGESGMSESASDDSWSESETASEMAASSVTSHVSDAAGTSSTHSSGDSHEDVGGAGRPRTRRRVSEENRAQESEEPAEGSDGTAIERGSGQSSDVNGDQDYEDGSESEDADDEEAEALSAHDGSDASSEEDDDDRPVRETSKTFRRNELRISLTQPVAGNFIMVKLIDQEDLMDEFDDQGPPNIDMTYVRCEGNFVEVPPFVYLA